MEIALKKSQNFRFQSMGKLLWPTKLSEVQLNIVYGVPMQKYEKHLPGVNFLYFFVSESYDAAWDR